MNMVFTASMHLCDAWWFPRRRADGASTLIRRWRSLLSEYSFASACRSPWTSPCRRRPLCSLSCRTFAMIRRRTHCHWPATPYRESIHDRLIVRELTPNSSATAFKAPYWSFPCSKRPSRNSYIAQRCPSIKFFCCSSTNPPPDASSGAASHSFPKRPIQGRSWSTHIWWPPLPSPWSTYADMFMVNPLVPSQMAWIDGYGFGKCLQKTFQGFVFLHHKP